MLTRRGIWIALFAAIFSLSGVSRAGYAETVATSFRLSNGLEVVVIPNHRIPAVCHMLWFQVGGADDPQGKSGLAHFHEHIMFKATDALTSGEYGKTLSALGAHFNAFTTNDVTTYHACLQRPFLPKLMALEAERMRGLKPTPEEVEKEREVIIEERRMRIDNNPQAQFFEQMQALLFSHHPYRLPVIGWKHEMEKLTREDVLDFHNRYTQAGNAVLILTGDITQEEAQRLAQEAYGALPSGQLPPRNWNTEPPALAPRSLQMQHAQIHQPMWAQMWQAPSLKYGETSHAMPLMLLAHMLGGSNNSRLYQSLVVEKKLALATNASYDLFTRGPSKLQMTVQPAPGVGMQQISDAVALEIKRFQTSLVDNAELTRVKKLMKAQAIYSREGLEDMAYIMGWIRSMDLPLEWFGEWTQRIDAVTAEQLRDTARALDDKATVTGWLSPETAVKKAAP